MTNHRHKTKFARKKPRHGVVLVVVTVVILLIVAVALEAGAVFALRRRDMG